MFVVLEGKIAGLVSVADPVKETTPAAIKALHAEGFRIIMATGDNERTARSVASRLGIDEIRADVLPEDKARIIQELQAEGHKVAMAGDGVNDAPALAQADVGIAMGTGADVAIESAGFTLVKGNLDGIIRARKLSRATMRQHQAEPFLRARLQRGRRAGRRRGALSLLRHPRVADLRGGGDEPVVGLGDRQRVEAAQGANLVRGKGAKSMIGIERTVEYGSPEGAGRAGPAPRIPLVPLGMSLGVFLAVSYCACIAFDLLFPDHAMHETWHRLLPGFTWLTWPGFLIGLVESFAYGWYVALVFVPLYNFFAERSRR